MITVSAVMLSKSFVHPPPAAIFFTGFRSPRVFPQPFFRTLHSKSGEASSASPASRGFSARPNYDHYSRNVFVVRPRSKPWREEVWFHQITRSKDLPIRGFSSQCAVSQGIELPSLPKQKERVTKRRRYALAAGYGDRKSLSSFSVYGGFSPVSPQEKRVPPNSKSHDSDVASESGIEQSLVNDRFRIQRSSSASERKEHRSEGRTAFEQWAVNKIREEGLSSLPVIEEMRQTFAPDSPPLDPRLLYTEAELRELENRTIVNKSSQLRTKRSDKKFSSTTTSQVMPVTSKPPQRGLSDKITNVKQSEDNKSEVAGSPPKPLLVKRKTSLPDNWNGPGGTVVLIDKPQGWTSFAVCGKLRHTLKIQKVGHAGTLDPLATGLLIVCLGKATKLADSYQAMTKVYSGIFRLGEDTPSLDADTEVSDTLPWEHIKHEDIQRAKQAFVGDILQSPPMYSAIKVKGERLYKKARRGEEIEVPARPVTVHEFQVNRSPNNRQEFHFRVTCSKGTYIRSLCSDLGRALGSYAHLTALRRERIGSYSVSDAWTVKDLVENYSQQCTNFTSGSKA